MNETNANYVTMRKFRLAVGLSALLGVVVLLGLVKCLKPLTVKSTPIVVRGGSMAAFTISPGGWVVVPGIDLKYCTNVDPSFIELKNDESDSVMWSQSTPAPSTWTIKVYGHDSTDHKTSKQSGNGLLFSSSQTIGCDKKPGKSVVVSSFGSGDFYQSPLPLSGKRTGNVRFLDNASEGCKGGDLSNHDQDFCERMSAIEINLSTGTSPPILYCADGDCTLHLGPYPSQ